LVNQYQAARLKYCAAIKKTVLTVAPNNGNMVWINFFDHTTVKLLEEKEYAHSYTGRRAVVLSQSIKAAVGLPELQCISQD